MTEWFLLLAAVVLTLGTAFFVAAEFSLVALDRPTVEQAVQDGDRRAAGVLASLRRLSTQLSAAQVGITVTTLVVGFLAEPSLGALIAGPLEALGWSEGLVTALSSTLALLIATVFSMIVGELVPQFLGISAPLRTAAVVATPVRAFSIVVRPLIALLNGSANRALGWVGIEPQEELSSARTPRELASLVRRSAQMGTLDEPTARMVAQSLDLGDRTAADVMTPRPRCVAVPRTGTAEDVVALTRQTGHSRFPVIDEDWDDIDGVVHVKAAVAVPPERRAKVPVSALMTEAIMVPETVRLRQLLQSLRESGLQLAVVVDEYGGTAGLVSLEDVVEELVGEVSDEHDPAQPGGWALRDGTWTVPGLWRPDEVRSALGAPVPDGPEYETTGGFVMSALGRVPQVGDVVDLPGWTVRVMRMDGRRVDRLRFTPVVVGTVTPADPPSSGVDAQRPAIGDQPPAGGPAGSVTR